MRRTHKPRNINDQISTREIQSRELRATLLGNQPDWKPTHETTYQHTRRRCDGRRMVRRARASFATQRRAKRDRQVSRAGGPSDARNNAEAAAPVTGHDTRYGARHPLRGATPDQKGCTAYGSGAAHPITRTNAESARRGPGCGARGRRQGLAGQRVDAPSEARGADGSRAGHRPRARQAARPSASAQQQLSQHSTSRRRGRRRR